MQDLQQHRDDDDDISLERRMRYRNLQIRQLSVDGLGTELDRTGSRCSYVSQLISYRSVGKLTVV
jgi:hypothetical protein